MRYTLLLNNRYENGITSRHGLDSCVIVMECRGRNLSKGRTLRNMRQVDMLREKEQFQVANVDILTVPQLICASNPTRVAAITNRD